MKAEAFDWFRLACVRGLGAKSARLIHARLGEEFPSVFWMGAGEFCERFPEFGRGKFAKLHHAAFAQDVSALREAYESLPKGATVLSFLDERYPFPEEDAEAPPVLTALRAEGDALARRRRKLAVVGARELTEEGRSLARQVAGELAERFVIVSGYARGVDEAAHRAALEAGGWSVAALPCGLSAFRAKRGLSDEARLSTLSEFAPWAEFSGRRALQRNRTVVRLSEAVVVVACGPERQGRSRSGTYQTAEIACRMGKPVFVLRPDAFADPPPGNGQLLERLPTTPFREASEIVRLLEEWRSRPRLEQGRVRF